MSELAPTRLGIVHDPSVLPSIQGWQRLAEAALDHAGWLEEPTTMREVVERTLRQREEKVRKMDNMYHVIHAMRSKVNLAQKVADQKTFRQAVHRAMVLKEQQNERSSQSLRASLEDMEQEGYAQLSATIASNTPRALAGPSPTLLPHTLHPAEEEEEGGVPPGGGATAGSDELAPVSNTLAAPSSASPVGVSDPPPALLTPASLTVPGEPLPLLGGGLAGAFAA
ncbi:hypothetical protein T484DRAFT_1882038, partial [Baffinella frigidus]